MNARSDPGRKSRLSFTQASLLLLVFASLTSFHLFYTYHRYTALTALQPCDNSADDGDSNGDDWVNHLGASHPNFAFIRIPRTNEDMLQRLFHPHPAFSVGDFEHNITRDSNCGWLNNINMKDFLGPLRSHRRQLQDQEARRKSAEEEAKIKKQKEVEMYQKREQAFATRLRQFHPKRESCVWPCERRKETVFEFEPHEKCLPRMGCLYSQYVLVIPSFEKLILQNYTVKAECATMDDGRVVAKCSLPIPTDCIDYCWNEWHVTLFPGEVDAQLSVTESPSGSPTATYISSQSPTQQVDQEQNSILNSILNSLLMQNGSSINTTEIQLSFNQYLLKTNKTERLRQEKKGEKEYYDPVAKLLVDSKIRAILDQSNHDDADEGGDEKDDSIVSDEEEIDDDESLRKKVGNEAIKLLMQDHLKAHEKLVVSKEKSKNNADDSRMSNLTLALMKYNAANRHRRHQKKVFSNTSKKLPPVASPAPLLKKKNTAPLVPGAWLTKDTHFYDLNLMPSRPFRIAEILPHHVPNYIQVLGYYLPNIDRPDRCNQLFCIWEHPNGYIEHVPAVHGDVSVTFCPLPSTLIDKDALALQGITEEPNKDNKDASISIKMQPSVNDLLRTYHLLRLTYDNEIISEPFAYHRAPTFGAYHQRVFLSLCAIVKKEGFNLLEWIEYHRLMGYDRFILYDNNPVDEPDLVMEKILQLYPSNIIRKKWNHVHAQTEALTDCIRRYGNTSRWMSFIDVDEFMVPSPKYRTIRGLLKDGGPLSKRTYLRSYWTTFGPCGNTTKQPGQLVMEMCLNTTKSTSNSPKSTFMPHLAMSIQGYGPHYIRMWKEQGMYPRSKSEVSIGYFSVYHYRYRTWGEFVTRRRGPTAGRVLVWDDERFVEEWTKGILYSQRLPKEKNHILKFVPELRSRILLMLHKLMVRARDNQDGVDNWLPCDET